MKYYVKSIIKLLIVVFIQLLMVDFSFANPIPVFCLVNYGFIKTTPEWNNICKGGINIFEYKYGDGDIYSKRYLLKK